MKWHDLMEFIHEMRGIKMTQVDPEHEKEMDVTPAPEPEFEPSDGEPTEEKESGAETSVDSEPELLGEE